MREMTRKLSKDKIAPTLERQRHSKVERLPRSIPDQEGVPSQPYRSIDILAAMERRGAITVEMRNAGEDFRARFRQAQLDPLKSADISRPYVTGGFRPSDGPVYRIEGARNAVWREITAAGGIVSPGGSCLWHVIGCERSLKEWALEQGWNGRRVSQEAASGILIAALGALAARASPTHHKELATWWRSPVPG